MDTNKKTKNKRKNKNQRRKSNQGSNLLQNKKENPNIEEPQNIEIKISASPRPNNLLRNNCEIKRSSGSEFEDIQTPSIEYDIVNDNINENDCEYEYDKAWDDIGSFAKDNSSNLITFEKNSNREIVENNIIHNIIYNEDNLEKEKLYITCNGNIATDENTTCTLGILAKEETNYENDETSINNSENNYKLIEHCEKAKESENEENKFVNDDDVDVNKEEFCFLDVNKSQSPMEDYENVEQQVINECMKLSEEVNEGTDYQACINYVDQFFEDLDDECYKYPIEESNNTEIYIIDNDTPINVEVQESISVEKEDTVKLCSEEKLDEKIVEQESFYDESFTLICTDENINDEILHEKPIVLDVIQPPLILKSMTLKSMTLKSMSLEPRLSTNSLKQSATSITNISSISDDTIPYNTEREFKKLKNNKSNTFNTFNIYLKLKNKFHKGKSPTKETSNNKKEDCSLSLKSENLVKDSEIESNQSLKSNNDFDNSQILSETISTEIAKQEHEKDKNEDITENIENEITIKLKEMHQTEINKENVKPEKNTLFRNILKKKDNFKKHSKEKSIETLPVQETKEINIASSTNKNESINPEKVEIEIKTIEEYNDVLRSIMPCETETFSDNTVVTSLHNQSHVDVHKDIFLDSKVVPYLIDDVDDHLFPDAITATKIFGFKPPDVPYIDDVDVILKDSMLLYNGENKRFRIHPDFFVPMASMESLYFPGDSIRNETFEKSMVLTSPCKSRNILENIIGYLSRGW